MDDYCKLYRRGEWREFRERCLVAAGYKCERCDNTHVLQVHHPEYEKGRKPWEYEIEFCEVLCRGCHAEEHGIIPPRSGWVILDSDYERNEPSEPVPCANCQRDVSWHVRIYHPEWGEAIVGSSCGENLSLGPEFTALKSYHRRLRTFVASPRWRHAPGSWLINQDVGEAFIFEFEDGFRLEIDNKWGKFLYKTLAAAKVRVFEVFENRRIKALEN